MMGRFSKGFTMIELLIVVAITTIGFIAILNLQIGALHGTGSARDQQMAVALAEHVGATMRLEALSWTASVPNPSALLAARFILNAPADSTPGQTSGWIVGYPDTSGQDSRVGPAGGDPTYDAGIVSAIGSGNAAGENINRHFCVHYRLTWLESDLLLRADIRVMWPRHRSQEVAYRNCPLTMVDRLEDVKSLTVPITVMRNLAP